MLLFQVPKKNTGFGNAGKSFNRSNVNLYLRNKVPGGSYFGTGHITVRFPSPWVMPQELGGRIVATATEDYRHWHLDGSLASMRVATRLPQNTLSCHVKVAMHSIRHRYQIKQIGVTNVLIFKSRYRLCFFSETIFIWRGFCIRFYSHIFVGWLQCSRISGGPGTNWCIFHFVTGQWMR